MSAPPFALTYTDEALRVLDDLTKLAYATKLKKAKKTLPAAPRRRPQPPRTEIPQVPSH